MSNCNQEASRPCCKTGEDCGYMMGLDDATDYTTVHNSYSRASVSPIVELNDAEKARWDKWEQRDNLSGRKEKKTSKSDREERESAREKAPQAPQALQAPPSQQALPAPQDSHHDRSRATRSPKVEHSSSSSLDSSINRLRTAQKREQAQSLLLDHAKKAQEMNRQQVQSILSTKTEDTDTLSHEEKSTTTGVTFIHEEVLQKFSSMLRNDKVEVLKLNRHGKWQLRYITVSREVSWLHNSQVPPTPTSSQCPQALLWYKGHNTKNNGLAGLRNDGRGGFLFSQLQKVERDPNVNPPAPIPKKLKAKFGSYAGVKIQYICEDGDRDLVFCFQDPSDAKAFCTAVDIIHQVVLRSADDTHQ